MVNRAYSSYNKYLYNKGGFKMNMFGMEKRVGDMVIFPKKIGDYYTKELELVSDRGVITEINNGLYTIKNDKGKYFVCKEDVLFADPYNDRTIDYTEDMVYKWKRNDTAYSWFGTGFDMIDFTKPAPVVKKKKKYNIAALVALKSKNDNGKSGRKNK
jgi:hypothetical protein